MLTAIVFFPIAAGIVVAVAGRDQRRARLIALGAVVVELGLTLVAFAGYDSNTGGFDLVERADWIAAFDVQYLLGMDGLSAPMLLLNGILGVAAVLVSWGVSHRSNEFFMWLLVLQGAVMGSNRFRVDFPRLIELYKQGRLHLDDLVSDRIGLDGITGALQNLKDNKGTVARQVVMFD